MVTDFGVAGQEVGLKPRGEFIIVSLEVSNVGNEPQSFFVQNQKLFDAEGREYAADTRAAIRINEDAMALNLGPGFNIKVYVRSMFLEEPSLHMSSYTTPRSPEAREWNCFSGLRRPEAAAPVLGLFLRKSNCTCTPSRGGTEPHQPGDHL